MRHNKEGECTFWKTRFFLKTQKDIEVVGEAKNGLEAIELVESLKPDVVLMDLVMPELDGIQATEQIKTKWPEVKVLMLCVR